MKVYLGEYCRSRVKSAGRQILGEPPNSDSLTLYSVTCSKFYKLHQHFISIPELTLISPETVVPRLPKFMQTLDDIIYRELEKIAKRRGITIQELIRAVIVPE